MIDFDDITEEDLGKDFNESLGRVVEVRINKRKEYGDTFKEDTPEFLMMQIKNKLKRIELRLDKKEKVETTEKVYDNIIDAINYLHFLDIVLRSEDKNDK